MTPIKIASVLLIATTAIAGCSSTQGGTDNSVRSAAPALSDPAVPAGLQEAASGEGLRIAPASLGYIPGLGSGQAYSVSKGSDTIGRIVVKTDQSTNKIQKLLGSIVGKNGEALEPIPTDRGTFKVVQLPLGVVAAAGFNTTFVLLQTQTPTAATTLAQVAQGA